METNNTMKIIATCCVATVVVLFVYVVYESRMLSYFSSDPKTCINCHTMNTQYATWQHSAHREQATCIDCHLPRDSFFKKIFAKTLDGYNHSVAMTFSSYGYNLRITANAAERIHANCISCHEEAVSQMMINAKLYKTSGGSSIDRLCWDCHRKVPHGTPRNVTATQNNLGVKEN